MIEVTIPSLGSPPAFTVDTSAINYWEERAAYEYSYLMYNLNTAGFKIQKAVAADFAAFAGDTTDAVDDYMSRYEDFLKQGFTEVVANLPDLFTLLSPLLAAGSEAVIPLLLQGILDVMLRHRDKKAESGELSNSEVVAQLQAIEARLQSALELGGKSVFVSQDAGANDRSLADIDMVGFVDSVLDGEDVSNLSLLRRVIEGFNLSVDVQGVPVNVTLDGVVVDEQP